MASLTRSSKSTTTPIHERSLGAYADFQQLCRYQLAAKRLPLIKNKKAISFLNGPYKTSIRGRGMEFEDVRQYQAGDDIRNIDWRVSARTGKAHTKVFHEEREKPVLIAIDQRQQMFFASRCAMKSVVAADLAAYIAWAAKHKGDRIGGLIFNDQNHHDIRPRNQRKTVLQMLHRISEYNRQLSGFATTDKRSINDALLELKRVAKPGSQVFVISDFSDINASSSALLRDLSKHCEVTALHIRDILDDSLPTKGFYKASNGEENLLFNANRKQTRTQYAETAHYHQVALQTLFGKYQIPLIPVFTDDNPLLILQHYFGQGQLPPREQPQQLDAGNL